MKKKLITCLILVAVAAGCALFIKNASSKNFVVLKNGGSIEVDDAWIDSNVVICEKNGEVLFIETQETQEILLGPINGPRDLLSRISCHAKNQLFYCFGIITSTGSSFLLWLKTAVNQPWQWITIALALTICLIGLIVIIRRQDNIKIIEPSTTAEIEQNSAERGYQLAGISEVEHFFLNMHRLQLSAPMNAPARMVPDSGKQTGSNRVYKISVNLKGEWKSRAMTIGPLGEGSGSKSQCFYVIFDTHMVIKIPAEPIKDFSDYIQRIRYEGQLVEKLAPRECIIPNISVIMNKIHPLPQFRDLPADQLEKRYITLLETDPEYHKYLKIGGNFAFFMNLSRYYFLSHVMDSLHIIEDQVRSIITADANLILDCHEFENRYGKKNGWLCFEMQKLFGQFDTEIKKLEAKSDTSFSADERQKKDWLFSHLAWQDISTKQKDLPSNLLSEVKILLQKITSKEAELIATYRRLAKEYAQARLFKRNKAKIEGIATNLLVLLDWLGENNVAMRDLKPDNLLVAGDPENYPLFLSSAEDYSIGLIDLETSVDYMPPKGHPTEQPQLGGTPAYSTPSHFFQNDILYALYQDLPLILNLQDWYATLGIIYEAVTGRRLFGHTARQISELVRNLQQSIMEDQPILDTYKQMSQTFWKSAVAEFQMKTKGDDRWLKSTGVFLPEGMRNRFKDHLLKEKQIIDSQIKEKESESKGAVQSQTEIPGQSGEKNTEENELSKRTDHLSKSISIVEDPVSKLPVKDLLEIMFEIVFRAMYPEHWQDLSVVDSKVNEDMPPSSEEDKRDATVGYTITVKLSS